MKNAVAGASLAGLSSISQNILASGLQFRKTFVHHVFFWLKNPENMQDRLDFEKGIEALLKVPVIKASHFGKPVKSDREVVDDSFTYSYMVMFDSENDQNVYQAHPIHLKFVEECSHLWKKVIVYDAMD